MAWTTPRTWSTGDTATAAMMNSHIRDNTNYLYDQPMGLITNTSNQSVTPNPGFFAAITWGTTIMSTTGTGINAAGITPTVSGVYETWFNVAWSGSVSGHRAITIYLRTGGSSFTSIASDTRNAVALGVAIFQGCSGTTPITSGFPVSPSVWQDSSGNQTLFGSQATEPLTGLSYGTPTFGIKMLGTGA